MTLYVIGSRGRLGRAIIRSSALDCVNALDRSLYEAWWQSGSSSQIAHFFKSAPTNSVILVTSGCLDPAASAELHQRINIELPIQIIKGASQVGLRVLTFGTVMEQLIGCQNPYVASKKALGQAVMECAAAGQAVTHVQLHTLYGGGLPAPHMFLGQMWQALRDKYPFEMSSGHQIREYHHVDDDANALHTLITTGITGAVQLSHGVPCTLRELASYIFSVLGFPGQLQIGALPEPPEDNYKTTLNKPEWLEPVYFRPALTGIADYFQELFQESV